MFSMFRNAAITMVVALASPAFADIITFETAPIGRGFTGPVTENGFTYSTLSGSLFVNQFGNPGQDMEGGSSPGGGVLKIVSTSGGNFNFDALDFSAFDGGSVASSQTLIIQGSFGGSLVGTDQYTLSSTSTFVPTYPNWTTEAASVLAGKTLSELDIFLNSGATSSENIDNVALTSLAAVPEPASLTLLAVGLAGLGMVVRRRRA